MFAAFGKFLFTELTIDLGSLGVEELAEHGAENNSVGQRTFWRGAKAVAKGFSKFMLIKGAYELGTSDADMCTRACSN